MTRKALSMLLAAALIFVLAAGCGGNGSAETSQSPTPPASSQTPAGTPPAAPEAPTEAAYPGPALPLDEPVTISVWINDMPHIYAYVDDWVSINCSKKQMEADTNIHTEYILCQDARTMLATIVASGDLPDIYYGAAANYGGGASKGAEDGAFMVLDDYVEDYIPLYYEKLESNPAYMRAAKTNDGHFVSIYQIYTEAPYNDAGPVVRGDWLDALGMKAEDVNTIQKYHDYLKAAKDKYGAKLLVTSNAAPYQDWFVGAFGVSGHFENAVMVQYPFYQQAGKIKFGIMEPGYLEFTKIMAQWYSEGLISEDFLAYTFIMNPDKDAMANGKYSMWWWGAHQSDSLKALQDDAGFYLAGLPEITDGVMKNPFGAKTDMLAGGMEISPTTKYLKECLAFLNYGFTDAGYYAYNFGIKDESYYIDKNGDVQYTDLIMDAINGMVPDAASSAYTMFNFGAHMRDYNIKYKIAGMFSDSTLKMVDTWKVQIVHSDAIGYLPSTLTLTTNDAAQYAATMSEVGTYISEMLPQFMMGQKSLNEWDAFLAQCKTLGIDDAIRLWQGAYDTYMAG